MNTITMNMIRIFRGNEVLVLDKKKKYGWEGLTFPGGKVEPNESIYKSVIRECKEETGLDIKEIEFNGIIQWYEQDSRFLGLLYTTKSFEGSLIEDGPEGRLFFVDYEEFLKMPNKSDSMEDILSIYNKECDEVVSYYNGSDHFETFRIKNE